MFDLKAHIPVPKVTRVYPAVVAIDRRVRVPGLRFWFDEVFAQELETQLAEIERTEVGALAVLALEDLEVVEQLVRNGHVDLKGTPRGLIRLLRLWELRREKLPKTGKRAAAWAHFIRDVGAPGRNDRLQAEADRWFGELQAIFKLSSEQRDAAVGLGEE
jgi:ABC-type transporter Mla MlaB component